MKQTKKILCILLSIIIILSFSSCTQSQKRSDKKLSEITYEGFDITTAQQTASTLDDLLNSKSFTKKKILSLYQTLISEFDKCSTQSLLAYAEYYSDPQNETYQNHYSEMNDSHTLLTDIIKTATGKLYREGLGYLIEKYLSTDRISYLSDYTALTDDMLDILDYENDLCTQYAQVSTSKDYSYKERCEIMGELIVQMVNERNTFAFLKGYSNYMDYAYDNVYVRDYTPEDITLVASYIRTYLRDDYFSLLEKSFDAFNEPFDSTRLLEGMKAIAENNELPSSVTGAAQYMLDYDLIYFPDSQKGMFTTWSGKLYSYNEPVIYFTAQNNIDDAIALLHESGHYLNFYKNDQSGFATDILMSLDVAETQSQTYMMLYNDEYSNAYPDNKQSIADYAKYSLIDYIYRICMYSEFEYELYTEPNLTYDRACELFEEMSSMYGINLPSYSWSNVHHYADYPAYVVSYVTSALATACIWEISLSDDKKANEIYDKVSAYGCETGFLEMCNENSLGDIFSQDTIIRLHAAFSK